jgi:hypothetical protein
MDEQSKSIQTKYLLGPAWIDEMEAQSFDKTILDVFVASERIIHDRLVKKDFGKFMICQNEVRSRLTRCSKTYALIIERETLRLAPAALLTVKDGIEPLTHFDCEQ